MMHHHLQESSSSFSQFPILHSKQAPLQTTPDEGIYHCNEMIVCGKKFYSCIFPNCGKSFQNKQAFMRHYRSHQPLKPLDQDREQNSFRNLDKYLKPKRTSSSELTDPATKKQFYLRLSAEIAVNLATEESRRDSLRELFKLQGIKVKEQKEPAQKPLKRNTSCDAMVTGFKTKSIESKVTSRRDSLGCEISCAKSGSHPKQNIEAKSTMCESDLEADSHVQKDEESTLGKTNTSVKSYKRNSKMVNRSAILDSSIVLDYEKRPSKEFHRQIKIKGLKCSFDQKAEKRLKDLSRTSTMFKVKDNEQSMIKSQRGFDMKESIESAANKSKKSLIGEDNEQSMITGTESYRSGTRKGCPERGVCKLKKKMEKIGIAKNMLLYNEISNFAMNKDLEGLNKTKVVQKENGSISARQSVEATEEIRTEKNRRRMILERIFARK